MRRHTKILLIIGAAAIFLSMLLETGPGQKLLMGDEAKLARMDHFQLDDAAMGAGLAPIVYGLVPGCFLVLLGLVCLYFDLRKRSKLSSSRPKGG